MIFNLSKYNGDWKTKELRELGCFNRGKSKHRPRNDKRLFSSGGYPLIQTGDVKEANIFISKHSNEYNDFGLAQSKLWPEGTLCITIAANIAETAILSYEMCFPDSVVGFNAYEEECSEVFMHYIFTYIRKAIQSRIQGSIQDNINLEYLTGLSFKIPERDKLRSIEKTLLDLDSKIELNNKINAELEAMAKLIYDYWFVQFDFPDESGKPYKSSGGQMVYNEELKREIPEGWEVRKVNEFMNFGSGFPFKSSSYVDKGKFKVITIKNVQDGFMDIEKTDYLDVIPKKLPEYCKLKLGDILISLTGNVGRMCRVFDDRCLLNQRVGKMIGKEEYFDFFYLLLNRPEERLNIENIASGSSQKNLSPVKAVNRSFVNPDYSILNEFNKIITPVTEKLVKNSNENKKLGELRDWLLPMLMNGQVTVN